MFSNTIMIMTQELKWPNKAMNDPYSLWNVPLSELFSWFEFMLENRKRENKNA